MANGRKSDKLPLAMRLSNSPITSTTEAGPDELNGDLPEFCGQFEPQLTLIAQIAMDQVKVDLNKSLKRRNLNGVWSNFMLRTNKMLERRLLESENPNPLSWNNPTKEIATAFRSIGKLFGEQDRIDLSME